MMEENAAFWSALDALIEDSEIVIDRPKGSMHPRLDFIYEVDYGYLRGTKSADGAGIDLWRGSDKNQRCDAVICTIDLLKRDSEIKILLGCTEGEKERIMLFHNESDFMKGLLFCRE